MNRREFIKYGLGGLFGMGLTWAGVVRGEEKQQDDREFCDVGCANCPFWDSCDNAPQDYGPQVEPEPPTLSKEEKREAFEAAVISEAEETMPQGGYLSVGSDAHIDELPDGSFTTHLVYDQWGNLIDAGTQYWDGQAWDIKINGKEQVSDNVSWDYSADTGGAPMTVPASLTACTSSESWEDVPPERDPCDSCTCRAECDADSVYWCSVEGIETRANNPWAPGGAPIDYYRHIDIPIGGEQVSDNVNRGVDCVEDCDDCPSRSRCLSRPGPVLAGVERPAVMPLTDTGPKTEEKVSWTLYREGKNIWSVGIDGSVVHSGDNGETWCEITTGKAGDDIAGVMWEKAGPRDHCPSSGAAIGFSAQYPDGRWVYWDVNGSDENGTGTTKDPVATKACAQSIADNPL